MNPLALAGAISGATDEMIFAIVPIPAAAAPYTLPAIFKTIPTAVP
jgi:hypothetical protein